MKIRHKETGEVFKVDEEDQFRDNQYNLYVISVRKNIFWVDWDGCLIDETSYWELIEDENQD